MVLKLPPPPPIAKADQAFNRWLLEVISIFNTQGTIDPSQVAGLPALIAQVTQNTADVVTLYSDVNTLNGEVAQNTAAIAALNGLVATLQVQVAALQLRSQVFNGSGAPDNAADTVGDWYADMSGLHIYVKTGVATWTMIV